MHWFIDVIQARDKVTVNLIHWLAEQIKTIWLCAYSGLRSAARLTTVNDTEDQKATRR